MMTSDGSAYARFRRALERAEQTGNVELVRAAAAELPRVELGDALRICWLLRDTGERYQRAAVRWLGRLCLEGHAISLQEAQLAATALSDLPHHLPQALAPLSDLCSAHRSGTPRGS